MRPFGTSTNRGVTLDRSNKNRGREGVKNPKIFADVLNGSPLTQITALMPHRNGAAVLHATDIKFDQSPGAMNVFCTSDATDLQRSYPVDFQQTANITTFMQKDIINADLGYMVNGGFSDLMKNWTVEDDQFVVLVEVQLQDSRSPR